MIGETLDGKYTIVSEIGSGGMGAVYEARHTGTGRRVAVKVITGELAKNDTLVSRFHREARAAGAIEAQHIVQVLDTGKDAETGAPFMVMEYLDGEDLQHLFQRLGPISADLGLRLAAQACLGLQKAHEARVVHRDIKPGNLFLTKRDDGDRLLKVLDFGVAKIRADQANHMDTGGLTRTGSMLGSPLYMSPEQARGLKNVDHRADIWSLGVVLYQAFAGRRPHEDVDSLGDLIIAICSEPPQPLQELAPWIAPEVAAIVHRALSFDPADRFQSASEMLDAMRPLLPDGWSISEALLVPLSDEARAVVAQRAEAAKPRESAAADITGDATVALEPTPSIPPRDASRPSLPPRQASRPSLPPPSAAPAERPKAAGITVGIIAIGAIGLVGGAFYAMSREPVAPPPPVAKVEVKPPPPVKAPEPVQAPAARTVQVVLLPSDVTAEVDGAPAKVTGGIVEITGTLGSVHRVRVTQGKRELLRDVVIAESGPIPNKVDLDASKP